jgi:aquaporin Z
MNLGKSLIAEFLGTFWLVFGGVGSALLAASAPLHGIGWSGVALAFGLTVLTGIYAFGPISGGHFNPAVTIGLWVAGRTRTSSVLPYIIVQVAAAIGAAFVLKYVAGGHAGFEIGAFASNGFGDLSPDKYGLLACAITEFVVTFFFVIVIIGATSPIAPAGFAGIAIGFALTLANLVAIPVTNASVNPARSTGPALIAGAAYVHQLWLFWVAPIAGALVAGLIGRVLYTEIPEPARGEVSPSGRARTAATPFGGFERRIGLRRQSGVHSVPPVHSMAALLSGALSQQKGGVRRQKAEPEHYENFCLTSGASDQEDFWGDFIHEQTSSHCGICGCVCRVYDAASKSGRRF